VRPPLSLPKKVQLLRPTAIGRRSRSEALPRGVAVAVQNRHWRVVGVNDLGRKHPLDQQTLERGQQLGRGRHPAAPGAAGDLQAAATQDLREAVEGLMVSILRGDDVGQQAGARQALLARWPRFLGRHHRTHLAVLAGLLGPHLLEDADIGRHVVDLLEECIQHFVKADGCTTPGRESTDAEHGLFRTLYSGGKAGTEVELVIVQNANHNWPSSQQGLSTTQELWDFLSRHPKRER
jgi:hypothetical protein